MRGREGEKGSLERSGVDDKATTKKKAHGVLVSGIGIGAVKEERSRNQRKEKLEQKLKSQSRSNPQCVCSFSHFFPSWFLRV